MSIATAMPTEEHFFRMNFGNGKCWGFSVMQRHEVFEIDIARGTPQRYNFQGEQASGKAEILILSMTWKPQLPSNR